MKGTHEKHGIHTQLEHSGNGDRFQEIFLLENSFSPPSPLFNPPIERTFLGILLLRLVATISGKTACKMGRFIAVCVSSKGDDSREGDPVNCVCD